MMWDKDVKIFPKSRTTISVFLEQFFLFLLICDVTFTNSYVSWNVFLAIIPIIFKNVCVCVCVCVCVFLVDVHFVVPD